MPSKKITLKFKWHSLKSALLHQPNCTKIEIDRKIGDLTCLREYRVTWTSKARIKCTPVIFFFHNHHDKCNPQIFTNVLYCYFEKKEKNLWELCSPAFWVFFVWFSSLRSSLSWKMSFHLIRSVSVRMTLCWVSDSDSPACSHNPSSSLLTDNLLRCLIHTFVFFYSAHVKTRCIQTAYSLKKKNNYSYLSKKNLTYF